ncbi:hypothetical protein [Tateyamaria sp.]|uniref:hypothetical protein n=1 Tax=Tateyamaria sp. TaxID=1929288 RepID=UPI00329BD63F
MHTAPPPKKALNKWLERYPSEKDNYWHLLLEQKEVMKPETQEALLPYFESAHFDARECFHKLARISLHPDDGETGCNAQYPSALPLTARKGLFGEVLAGLFTEADKFVGEHEWQIPVFLFRFHEDAGQYIYTLNRDPDRERQVLGRKGDDFIAVAVDQDGNVIRFIAGEAKWRASWTESQIDAVMLGPKKGPKGKKKHNNKGVWFEINRALDVPLGLEQLHSILEECAPDEFASVIASLDRILAHRNPTPVERTDLILLAGGSAKKRKKATALLPWEDVPPEYKAGRDLQVVEMIIDDGDTLIDAIYENLWMSDVSTCGTELRI